MEVDMSPMPYRTRSSAKRARSPSSPTQYDRPSKRVSSGHDTSVPILFPPFQARLRGRSEDWVSQTQDLRLESPSLEHSRLGTPEEPVEEEMRIEVDEPICDDDNYMVMSPARPPMILSEMSQAQYPLPPHPPYQPPTACLHHLNPNHLQIPSIQIQAATPSPISSSPQSSLTTLSLPPFTAGSHFVATRDQTLVVQTSLLVPPSESEACRSPAGTPTTAKKQRFTMGPRADCELCRKRVRGHYMHFD